MTQDDSFLDRRDFLRTASAAGVGFAMSARVGPLIAQGRPPNETVRVAVIGLNSRGLTHLQDVVRSPNAELAALCDVDAQVLAKAVEDAVERTLASGVRPRDLGGDATTRQVGDAVLSHL